MTQKVKNAILRLVTKCDKTKEGEKEMLASKKVGERLRELRKKKKETIVAVATVIGVAPSTLTAYELGSRTPRDGIKEKIANYYGKSVGAIFFK